MLLEARETRARAEMPIEEGDTLDAEQRWNGRGGASWAVEIHPRAPSTGPPNVWVLWTKTALLSTRRAENGHLEQRQDRETRGLSGTKRGKEWARLFVWPYVFLAMEGALSHCLVSIFQIG
jgi:hypothetical protein